MNRRSFMAAILAAGVAPAVAGSGVLMPIRKLWVPEHIEGIVYLHSYQRGSWAEVIMWDPPLPVVPGGVVFHEGREIFRNMHGARGLSWIHVNDDPRTTSQFS